jgi:hypothetical protein
MYTRLNWKVGLGCSNKLENVDASAFSTEKVSATKRNTCKKANNKEKPEQPGRSPGRIRSLK